MPLIHHHRSAAAAVSQAATAIPMKASVTNPALHQYLVRSATSRRIHI